MTHSENALEIHSYKHVSNVVITWMRDWYVLGIVSVPIFLESNSVQTLQKSFGCAT